MNTKNTLSRMLRLTEEATMALSLAVMLAAGVLLLALPASPAQAQQPSPQGTPDANCPGPIESYAESRGHQRRAQTFTAQHSGKLTSAQVEVFEGSDPSSDYVLAIHAVDASGVPTNTVLASATVPEPTVSGDVTITGNFADPATVEAGQQYALVVKRLGPDYLGLGIRVGDDCPGKAYISGSDTDPFGELSGFDLIFATFVEVNEPPLAGDDTYRVKKNGTLRVGRPGTLANDSDPNGDVLTARLVSGPRKGRLALNSDGSFTYKPKRNFSGTDSFVYEVDDGSGGTDTATVNIRVGKAYR